MVYLQGTIQPKGTPFSYFSYGVHINSLHSQKPSHSFRSFSRCTTCSDTKRNIRGSENSKKKCVKLSSARINGDDELPSLHVCECRFFVAL